MTATSPLSEKRAVAPAATYNPAMGYLRAFLVVLVIAHHAALAYHPFAPPPAASLTSQLWWGAFPVVDSYRSQFSAILVGFNDEFFMSLMFFVSGLFVWQSVERKGAAKFFRNRLFRLGLPFVVASAVLAPLAYYPAYLQTSGATNFAGFWRQWFALKSWPSGPVWFIWVLLAFDGIAALLFTVAPGWGQWLGRVMSSSKRGPWAFFAKLVAISAIAYIPMALVFSPLTWTAFGPFTFQTGRILHYFAYFLVGAGVGAWGVDRGPLAPTGLLARRWYLWMIASVLVFVVATVVTLAAFGPKPPSQGLMVAIDAGFVLSCAASSFAFLALFLRFARSRSRAFDSLGANSYAIYLVHYIFVNWLQYALLPASIPAIAKFAVVLFVALALSWGTAAAMRRIPAVARVV